MSYCPNCAASEQEIERLQAELAHAQIARDKEFWATYANDTCRALEDSNAKLTQRMMEQGRELEQAKERERQLAHNLVELTTEYDERSKTFEQSLGGLESANALAQQENSRLRDENEHFKAALKRLADMQIWIAEAALTVPPAQDEREAWFDGRARVAPEEKL